MPEYIKQCAEKAARAINSIPAEKREMATRLAETFAVGIATGMELTTPAKPAPTTTESHPE